LIVSTGPRPALAQPLEEGPPWTELTPDKVSAEDFAQLKTMMVAMSAELGPTKGATRAEVLEEVPAPLDLAPEAFAKLLERLGKSYFFGMRMGRHLTIEGDLSFFPLLAQGTLEVQWTKVLGPGAKNVLGKPSREETTEAAQLARFGLRPVAWSKEGLRSEVTLPLVVDAERAALVKAEGKAKLKVPTTFARIELPCTAGAKATTEGRTATVRRCENDFLQLDWSGTEEPDVVIRDASGRRLAAGPSTSLPVFKGGRTPLELEYRELPVTIEGKRMSFNVHGKVGSVLLVLPKEWTEKTLTVIATPEPTVDGEKPVKVAAPRALWDPPAGTGLTKITAAAVRSGTRVVAARTYAVVDYNQPKVEVRLPRVDNSLYASMEFPEATLVDASGKPVPHREDSIWVRWPELSNEVRFSTESGEGIVELARARGTVKLHFPVAMHTVTLTRAAPVSGALKAEFKGARVTIIGEGTDEPRLSTPSGAPHAFDLVRAFDKNGERLRQIGSESWSDDRHLLAFWGEPVEVRLVVADQWEDLELSYDLPPAQLLPPDKQGMKPD